MSHTPGPWEIGGRFGTRVVIPNGEFVAEVWNIPGGGGVDEGKANARPIAAAPDLADVAMAVSKRPDECKRMFEREGFIFDGTGGRWEKLALSLYTMLVIDCEAATEALRKVGEI